MKTNHVKTNHVKTKHVKLLILETMKQKKGLSLMLLTVALGTIVLSLIPPQLLKMIVDEYLISDSTGRTQQFSIFNPVGNIYKMAVLYLAIILTVGLFDFMKEGLLTILGQKITRKIRESMMEKMSKIPGSYFSSNDTGTVVSRFVNDVDSISSLFTNGIIGMFIDVLKIIGILVSIWLFSGKLALIVCVMIPIIYGITRLFQIRMLKAQMENRKAIAIVNNHIPESIHNIQMIHSFNKEKYMEEKYEGYLKKSFDAIEKVNFYDSIFSPIILIIRAVVIVITVILSADGGNQFGLSLGISVGMVAAAIELISNIFSPIETLGMELQGIQQAIAGIHRVDEFLMEPEETEKNNFFSIEDMIGNTPSNQVNIDTKKIIEAKEDIDTKKGLDTKKHIDMKEARRGIESCKSRIELEFENVSFGYNKKHDIFENVSMKISGNENVTFIGRTGVGKSTLFKLILGTLEPDSGKVMICGIESAKIPNSEKRKLFGYVEQKFSFVYGTVADQISLGDKSITEVQIADVLKFVGIYGYVKGLPNGMSTQASEDLFSKGQQQLLSIARAIVTDPPILLLDEMTANLDSDTETKIINVLQDASANRMLISISHRFSKVLKYDRKIKVEDRSLIFEK